jgi:hypothetical protein
MGSLSKYSVMARTLPRLGFGNIARVALYRSQIKLPSTLKRLSADTPHGPFFNAPEIIHTGPKPSTLWQDRGELFSFHKISIKDTPPDWLAGPLTGTKVKNADRSWYDIPDFDPEVGDIKLIWELSRMAWLLPFAQRAIRGDAKALSRLNNWLEDWVAKNPPYQGPNWKCGQEASLRVLHLIVAEHILGSAPPAFLDLIKLHLKRIAPTVSYATAQDNNHGTSEAAALFIGGNFIGDKKLEEMGRKLLENRIARLVGDDGSFAQYSVVYHRLMLDALSLSEWWRATHDLPQFSISLQTKMRAASDWLYRLTDTESGDAPNMGANDGAQILRLTDAPYRDFRPSVALAQALWSEVRVFKDCEACQRHLAWLKVSTDTKSNADILLSAPGKNGGFAVITQGYKNAYTKVILRHPRFNFRPSQSDALHLDLWHKGKNLLRDGGTYSYNTNPEIMAYFNGARGHNTVEFDGQDQMPRLGRFLLGDWLKTDKFEFSDSHILARYKNRQGHCHTREFRIKDNAISVKDEIAGFKKHAVLRWRLIDGDYKLTQNNETSFTLDGPHISLELSAPNAIAATLTTGEESRHYLSKTSCPVLEVTTQTAQTLTTHIKL